MRATTDIRVVSMQRSGTHAILSWIRGMFGEKTFYNDCVGRSWRSHGKEGLGPGFRERRKPRNDQFPVIQPHDPIPEDPITKYDLLIYNFEDCALEIPCCRYFERNRAEIAGGSERSIDVLILRDPFNMLASRMKFADEHRRLFNSPGVALELWKTHAQEFMAPCYLVDPITISYNLWCASEEYRKGIAYSLGVEYSDKMLQKVAKYGGGSSFDKFEKDGKAAEMLTSERWKAFASNELYKEYLKDEDLWTLSEAIFGTIPGTGILHE